MPGSPKGLRYTPAAYPSSARSAGRRQRDVMFFSVRFVRFVRKEFIAPTT
jgi:hypothetical protein